MQTQMIQTQDDLTQEILRIVQSPLSGREKHKKAVDTLYKFSMFQPVQSFELIDPHATFALHLLGCGQLVQEIDTMASIAPPGRTPYIIHTGDYFWVLVLKSCGRIWMHFDALYDATKKNQPAHSGYI